MYISKWIFEFKAPFYSEFGIVLVSFGGRMKMYHEFVLDRFCFYVLRLETIIDRLLNYGWLIKQFFRLRILQVEASIATMIYYFAIGFTLWVRCRWL